MTYCLGMLVQSGLVLAADARSNAGVDQVTSVSKLSVIAAPGERLIVILSAGNLATTQAVVTELREAAGQADASTDLLAARTMFDVAKIVGGKLRDVIKRDAKYVRRYSDPTGSFLIGGQIAGSPHRLFQVYPAGNVLEASPRFPFMQIGETKYGKPILDRALGIQTGLDEAAMLALLSFDATMRSNLSVGLPIDLLRYRRDSLCAADLTVIDENNPYWLQLRQDYSEGLSRLLVSLPRLPQAS